MSRTAIIFLSLNLIFMKAFAEKTLACTDYVQVVAGYDELVKGKLVKKYSIGEITEWSRHSTFDGFLLTEKAPKDSEFILDIKSDKSKIAPKKISVTKFANFKNDSKYRDTGIKALDVLGRDTQSTGSFRIQIKSAGKIICEESFLIQIGGE